MTNRQWIIWKMIDMDNLELAKFLNSSAWFCNHCPYCEADCKKKMADWLKQEHEDKLCKEDGEAVQDLMAFKERYKHGKA